MSVRGHKRRGEKERARERKSISVLFGGGNRRKEMEEGKTRQKNRRESVGGKKEKSGRKNHVLEQAL